MKTFLNVLYRRILYKIPLKRLLLGLAVFGVLFASFSSAVEFPGMISTWDLSAGATEQFGSVNSDYTTDCFIAQNGYSNCTSLTLENGNIYASGNPVGNWICINHDGTERTKFVNGTQNYCRYYFTRGKFSELFPKMSSLDCQTEYNLIPVESVDQNYCTTNNLCPSQECPVIPVGTGNLTQLYINNILHVGAPTILMDIPEEIDWDYEYTMGGNIMNIDIVGYNVDYDKINEQINLQNFKPSSEDLSQVVSGIIPLFVPGLCIILLLYFIFKFIKKIF